MKKGTMYYIVHVSKYSPKNKWGHEHRDGTYTELKEAKRVLDYYQIGHIEAYRYIYNGMSSTRESKIVQLKKIHP